MSGTSLRRMLSSGGVCVVALVAIVVSGTPVAGAHVSAQGASETTFTKDVAPILQRSCQACHRPDSIAPMSLLTYEDARPWARAIKEKVGNRIMPPWYIDKNIGVQGFKGDRSLTDEEIATIVAWVDAGAPRGDPGDMPPPRAFLDPAKWHTAIVLGDPDWVVPIPEPFVVPAEAPNWWGNLYSDAGLTEERWIKAVETKPSAEGFPVVHHAVTSVVQGDDDEQGQFLNEYAQGKNGDIFAEDTGRLVKANSGIRFNMHYASIGREISDRTSVGLWFYPKGAKPKYELFSKHTGDNADLDIPPGESDIRHDGYHRFAENVVLTGFQPHLHNRGKRQCIEAIYPDNRVETLSCANWDFGWHIVYNYKDETAPLLPKGTILHTITWHDNSPANRWNPDPRNWAGFGQRSSDDMSFTWTSWYTLSDEEFQQRVEARKAATSNNN